MKYKSLIGEQEVCCSIHEDIVLYKISIKDKTIIIHTERALKDALKLGIIEEIKPEEFYRIKFGSEITFDFKSKSEAKSYLDGFNAPYKIIKFREVIE
jgi:hypothetical protein